MKQILSILAVLLIAIQSLKSQRITTFNPTDGQLVGTDTTHGTIEVYPYYGKMCRALFVTGYRVVNVYVRDSSFVISTSYLDDKFIPIVRKHYEHRRVVGFLDDKELDK